LSEGAGYAVVVGFGAFFSIFTTILVFLDYRFGGTKQTSEQVCPCTLPLQSPTYPKNDVAPILAYAL
jgi:hypothetical protein